MVGIVSVLEKFAGGLGLRDLGTLYFSGHGPPVGGEGYLLPVDFERTVETEMPHMTLVANQAWLPGDNADCRPVLPVGTRFGSRTREGFNA